MDIVTEILISLVVVVFVLWWFTSLLNKNNNFYTNIPGPPTIPILGNALDFKSTTELLDVLLKYTKEYGDVVKVQMGPTSKFVVVADYKFLQFILSSTQLLNKSEDYHYVRPWLGTGLLTADGPKWKKHRKILTPVFHFQNLKHFIEIFDFYGERLMQKLEMEVEEKSFDIYPYITLCTLDIICDSIMGTSIDALNNDNSDYVRSVKDMCRIIVERSISPIGMHDLLFPLTKNYYTQRKALKILHSKTKSVITQRQKELKERKMENKQKDTIKNKIFLDLLLETTVDGRPLTQEEIMNEVDTFMFEGHDTTASAISFTLFCLANHPQIQSKAFEEQQTLFGNNKNPAVTYADLQNMKYLELVIKESLRLYPSVPMYLRQDDENIKYDQKPLPQGDTIIIFAYGIHRNPKYFNNPENFDPSRFENIDGRFPYAYIPFSAGPRNCIGQKFAMLEMKSLISKILRKFELTPAFPKHTLKLASETVLKSTTGIKISLKLRQ